jgi:hypothetical protein
MAVKAADNQGRQPHLLVAESAGFGSQQPSSRTILLALGKAFNVESLLARSRFASSGSAGPLQQHKSK